MSDWQGVYRVSTKHVCMYVCRGDYQHDVCLAQLGFPNTDDVNCYFREDVKYFFIFNYVS